MQDSHRVLLEVAVELPEEARWAVEAGADRIELSSAIEVGGITASPDSIQAVRAAVSCPLFVLIRPRAGGFVYDAVELALMEQQITTAIALGADGLVFGALTAPGCVDESACRRLLRCCGGKPAVFHRAFDSMYSDALHDPRGPVARARDELELLVKSGFPRVLTSAGCVCVADPPAPARLRDLIDSAAGRIEILPGGGVRPHNVQRLVQGAGCRQVHSSCRSDAPGKGGCFCPSLVAELRRELDNTCE